MNRQLDIFEDSRDLALSNDLARALLDGDAVGASRIADVIRAEFGEIPILAPAALLIEHLRWQQSQAVGTHLDLAALLEARRLIDGPIRIAAVAAFGAGDAPGWLDTQWRWLGDQAVGIGWNPAHADAHAAAQYLRGRAWAQAAAAVARIPSWRRIPVSLLWMTQAVWHGKGTDEAWPLLAEALWLAPGRTVTWLRNLADKRLALLLARFEERFEPGSTSDSDWAWLPAFALVEQPLLAGPLSGTTSPPNTAHGEGFSEVMALLRLERQGRHAEIVAHRARLKSLSPGLFAAYMVTR